MKKTLLIAITSMFASAGIAQTATDFTINDCGGTSHHLFAELDAGKVIVIAFVDPCGSCIVPSGNAYGIVQSYASSYPGKVVFYLSDDVANSPCSTLNTWWTSTVGEPAVPTFSDPACVGSNYGALGMPKIVVLGGNNHHVFFNQNNGLDHANFTAQIDAALLVSNVAENATNNFQMYLFPNPVTGNSAVLKYNLNENTEVTVEVMNTIGEKVKSISYGKQAAGKNETALTLDALSDGLYFVKLTAGKNSQLLKFAVKH